MASLPLDANVQFLTVMATEDAVHRERITATCRTQPGQSAAETLGPPRALWSASARLPHHRRRPCLESRRQPDLELWHKLVPAAKYRGRCHAGFHTGGLPRTGRQHVFGSGQRRVGTRSVARPSVPNRYVAASVSSPTRQAFNGNRTFERVPAQIRGGALLIHGLTDSPYSLHAAADLLASQGIYALVAPDARSRHRAGCADLGDLGRLDGRGAHGDASRSSAGGRGHADLPDRLLQRRCAGGEVLARGASDPALPRPSKLVLLSPMIGVSPFARFSWMMSLLGWIPYFEQSRWLDVLPEYLPFSTTSFPVNAARQTYRLTTALVRGARGRRVVKADSRPAANPHVPVARRHHRENRCGGPRAVRPTRRQRQRAGAVRRQPAVTRGVVLPRRRGRRVASRCQAPIA